MERRSQKLNRCPVCKGEWDGAGNPFRPFCSERCKMIDLGAWLDGKYAIPGTDAANIPPEEKDSMEDN